MKIIRKILGLLIVFAMIQLMIVISKSQAIVDGYTEEGNYIEDIQPNTKCSEFVKNIDNGVQYTIKENGTQINETALIKTGQVLTIGGKSYILVVTGDVNKDGKADIRDILQINRHRLKKSKLTGESLIAGDVNYDEKVDIKDILEINKYRLNKIQTIGRKGKTTVQAPTNVQISTGGIVTWNASNNATGYEISIDNNTWEEAESGVDYSNKITGTAGNKTVYVRAINSDKKNYISPSNSVTAEVTVCTVTIKSSNTEMGTVSPVNINVIKGTKYTTEKNLLIIKGATTGTNTKNIATITATAKPGYDFIKWASNSGTINSDVILTAMFLGKVYTITLDSMGADLPRIKKIYQSYNVGFFMDDECSKEITTNNAILKFELPRKDGYTFMGYYTEPTGGIQYITPEGNLNNKVKNTYFTDNVTLYAHWEITLKFAKLINEKGYLETTIQESKIKSITFKNSVEAHIVDNIECFDVSSLDNSGKVLLWIENTDSEGKYDICIGQNGGVIANPNSANLFSGLKSLEILNLTNLKKNNITKMSKMFYDCFNLTSIDTSSFDTSNVTDMNYMFYQCSGLTSLDVSNFNTSNVIYMNGMFWRM